MRASILRAHKALLASPTNLSSYNLTIFIKIMQIKEIFIII